MTSLHIPMRPEWICAGCGQLWPCHARPVQLLAEYDRAPVSLSLPMSSYFVEASIDLPLADLPSIDLPLADLPSADRPAGRRSDR
jgi:hypothetical protein